MGRKFGSKNIVLLDVRGEIIHTRYRYKYLRQAIRRAVSLSYEEKRAIRIWHLDWGQELAEIHPPPFKIHHRNLFIQLWNLK